MLRRRILPSVAALLLVAVTMAGAPPHVARASTVWSLTTTTGPNVCPNDLGGRWSGSTCYVTSDLQILSGTTLDVGAGVTVSGSDLVGITNFGTINNNGTMDGAGADTGIYNGAGSFINNRGVMDGTSITVAQNVFGIENEGTINNFATGSMSGIATAPGGIGVDNIGTINNAGYASGAGQTEFRDLGTINNYCNGNLHTVIPTNNYNCYLVTFSQSGVPSGATWGVTVTWPFGTTHYTSTGSSVSGTISLGGPINYSFDTPVTASGTTYACSSGCSGAPTILSAVGVSATYSATARAPVTTGSEICEGEASGRCFTSFISFDVVSGGTEVNANVTIVRQHGPTQTGPTEVGSPAQTTVYSVSVLDTISYTVTLPDGHMVSGTVSNPHPWTVAVIDVSG